ncbi:cytochrome c family protein [Rhodoblastus acidophilus]|uniref:Cytochrome c family protein n=1 Tax=Candidatus Rhodoblastus alkanivorans TaxID=2954117 RepID=A0ABS9Z5H1_9HYPH|nr:cytochrome c family protein [Candidatus Rhodoblastus alkanivorans]MCI4677628.1 cytochrome c family protein [Candidatus Rhodoblastus alkanivorans]MCI4682640.1 cytochrome c family protein [Candidatus Rhodoblastus alkanivorans]MDI4639946.1 cytochrome c family protein [Rhodoblastus acidophilus]
MKLIHALPAAAALAFISSSALAAGDPAAGAKVFMKCRACHQIGPGAKNGVGPDMNGLDGRKVGTAAGYSYSEAMKNAGFTWDQKNFEEYITSPKAKVPGNKMPFAGLPNATDRENVWAYISEFKADGSKK